MSLYSRFNPTTTSSPASSNPFRASYESQLSRSSQDSHISSMSTSPDHQPHHSLLSHHRDDGHQHHPTDPPPPYQQTHYDGGRLEMEKPLPSIPSSNNAPRSPRRGVTFAVEKPLPDVPGQSSQRPSTKCREKIKRTSSRDGGYVWYAKNCKKIHDQCEADMGKA